MARSLWTGAISFGLINVPVSIISTKEPDEIRFHLLDKRDHSRIGYRQINKTTGKEVSRDDIVKAYEYEKDQYVIVNDKDFEAANPRATQTIDIEDFVKLSDIPITYFEKPYYLLPGKGGEKGYDLLRSSMSNRKMVAIGRIVLHRKQHLVAIIASGNFLILEVLRFAHELVTPRDLDIGRKSIEPKFKVSSREADMAEKLIESMSTRWHPEKYKDTYHDDIVQMIERKIRTGHAVAGQIEAMPKANSNIRDLMPLLQKSLSARKKPRRRSLKESHGSHRIHA